MHNIISMGENVFQFPKSTEMVVGDIFFGGGAVLWFELRCFQPFLH
jgi:hypothetical protein